MIQLIVLVMALAMVTCTLCISYVVLGSYDGLGLKQTLPENPYDGTAFYDGDGRLHYEDGTYRTVSGIDVSYYQQDIDWEKVKASGIDFVMIRVGYRGSESGELCTDSRFKSYIKGARKAGLDVGVYFFSQAVTTEEAIEEAKFVIRRIRGKGVTYPVAFDMEPVSKEGRIADLTTEEKTEIADAFCQIISRNGYTPVIYGNPQWLEKNLNLAYLTDYGTWLAHYTDDTDYPYAFDFWQYTDSGRVDGIAGNVDLDLFFVKKD